MTLIEVMVVVAMIGVMAALALVGYYRYVNWANIASTKDIIGGLANGQMSYYADTEGYLDCSSDWSTNELYPMAPNDRKHPFHNPGHGGGDYACFRLLNPTVKEPTYASFWVRAGSRADGEATPVAPPPGMTLTNIVDTNNARDPERPWFVIVGVTDRNADGTYNYFMTIDTQISAVIVEEHD